MLDLWGETGQMQWLAIDGRSMVPLMGDGDQVLVEFRPRTLEPGDVIVFRRAEQLVAHRVIRLMGQGDGALVVAKGDNVAAFDLPCPLQDVVGRVHALRGRGREHRLDGLAWRVVGRAIVGVTRMTAWACVNRSRAITSRVVRKLAQWSIRGLVRVAMFVD